MKGRYLERATVDAVQESLRHYPVTAIVGPRQCGKSTLVRHLLGYEGELVYLDLERPSDRRKLEEPEWFLSRQRGKLVCIDEVQRRPELFPLTGSLVDEWGGNGHFLILGSASPGLLRQSSESLAGRITYRRLTPFLWEEVRERVSIEECLSRGGFPGSLLQQDDAVSFGWREDFITSFLERDLLQWRGFSPGTMRRLWQMLAHSNARTLNLSSLGGALGISHTSVRNYIDLLEETFMVTSLSPLLADTGKRLVRSPKVYLGDTGIVAALLGLGDSVSGISTQSPATRCSVRSGRRWCWSTSRGCFPAPNSPITGRRTGRRSISSWSVRESGSPSNAGPPCRRPRRQ